MMTYNAVTQGIEINVQPRFLESESSVLRNEYAFSYKITIKNTTTTPVQLLSRHWFIADALGDIREVEGLGVVGQQPEIAPQGSFSYESWAPIATPTGSMYGFFNMRWQDKKIFKAEIPVFKLLALEILN